MGKKGNCGLCNNYVELKNSHIISKMFFKEMNKGDKIIDIKNPKFNVQDGLKEPFLCSKCEGIFSKYEVYFSDNIFQKIKNGEIISNFEYNEKLLKFIISINWRLVKYIKEISIKKFMQNYQKVGIHKFENKNVYYSLENYFKNDIKLKKEIFYNFYNLNIVIKNWKDYLYYDFLPLSKIHGNHFIFKISSKDYKNDEYKFLFKEKRGIDISLNELVWGRVYESEKSLIIYTCLSEGIVIISELPSKLNKSGEKIFINSTKIENTGKLEEVNLINKDVAFNEILLYGMKEIKNAILNKEKQ